MPWLYRLVKQNKPKALNVFYVNKIKAFQAKQTQTSYLTYYQLDTAKIRPFYDENKCGTARPIKDLGTAREKMNHGLVGGWSQGPASQEGEVGSRNYKARSFPYEGRTSVVPSRPSATTCSPQASLGVRRLDAALKCVASGLLQQAEAERHMGRMTR